MTTNARATRGTKRSLQRSRLRTGSWPVVVLLVVFIFPVSAVYATGLREAPGRERSAMLPSSPIVLPSSVVRVAVIAGTTPDDPLRSGAEEAAREINSAATGGGRVVLLREGILADNAIDLQINLVENAVARGADAILLDPLDPEALAPYVERAWNAGVVVITLNNRVDTESISAHVSTDIHAATRTVVDTLVFYTGRTGVVGIVTGDPRSETVRLRREGILERMQIAYPEIRLLDSLPEGASSADGVVSAVTDMIVANPDIVGILATDAVTTRAAAQGTVRAGRAGEVIIIGFDPDLPGRELVRRGTVRGFLAEDPYTIGFLGMVRALEALSGETIPRVNSVPYRFIGPVLGPEDRTPHAH